MLVLVINNLMQRPARSVLTIGGIAIAIGAVVSLTSLAWGFEEAWTRVYIARGTDLVVTKSGSLSPVAASFDETKTSEIAAVPGVADVSAMLGDVMSVEDVPIVLVFGWQPGTFAWRHVNLVAGAWPQDDEARAVVLGSVAADLMDKRVGSTVQIQAVPFTVSGIFESGALAENGSIVMRLQQLQKLSGKPNQVNFINIKLANLDDADQVRRAIAQANPGFRAVSPGEVANGNAAIRVVAAMSKATAVLALLVGSLGVANTALMSVFERFHEIGVLMAVGWRRRSVLVMILCESIVLGLSGGVLGSVFGIATIKVIERLPIFRGKLEGDISVALIGVALAIAVSVSVLGGLYPAYRASRLSPAAALRYE